MVPEHGDYNPDLRKWYCDRWLSREEWEDIHDYLLAGNSIESSDNVLESQTAED